METILNDIIATDFQDTSKAFIEELKDFFLSDKNGIITVHKNFVKDFIAEIDENTDTVIQKLFRYTTFQLKKFCTIVHKKFITAMIEPGTAVGALGATSIGEPSTQMTLKTFHFAGVASMNITLGVPRIREIINASKTISTPIITAPLVNNKEVRSARIVKGRIEKTTLGEITKYIKEVFKENVCYLSIKLDLEAINSLQLEISAHSIKKSLLSTDKAPKLKLKDKNIAVISDDRIHVYPIETGRQAMYYSIQFLKNALPKVIVCGIPSIQRAVINEKKKKEKDKEIKEYYLLVEGIGLKNVMATAGIDWRVIQHLII